MKAELTIWVTAHLPIDVRKKHKLQFLSQIHGAGFEVVWDGEEAEKQMEQDTEKGREID